MKLKAVFNKVNIKPGQLGLLAAVFIAGVAIIYFFVPETYHWPKIFFPAVNELVHFRNPYKLDFMFYPPWLFLPILPLAFLPVKLGSAILSMVNLFVFGIAAKKLGAKPVVIALFLTLPQVIYTSFNHNVDCLVALGMVLPPQIGLFLVMAKPQAGGLIALFWAWQAWKSGGAKELIQVFAPVTLAYILSFAIFGPWILEGAHLDGMPWNTSLWPASIPIGLALLVLAFRTRRSGLAASSSPFLFPYVANYSWSVSVLGLLPNQLEAIAAIIGLWIVTLITGEPNFMIQ